VRTGAGADRLDGGRLRLADGGAVEAAIVVVAVGRIPNTDDLGLERAEIPLRADGSVAVGADRRATPAVAAIGDVIAGPALAHRAVADAAIAVDALSGRPVDATPPLVSEVVFCDPEVATVGLSEAQARAGELDVAVSTVDLAGSGRAATMGEREGFTRLVADRGADRIVGVQIVGPHASELIAEAALAIEMVAAPGDLAATIHPHPTLSETLAEAAQRLDRGGPEADSGARIGAAGDCDNAGVR
jgi:dihydrolipoamide dehydrogenase